MNMNITKFHMLGIVVTMFIAIYSASYGIAQVGSRVPGSIDVVISEEHFMAVDVGHVVEDYQQLTSHNTLVVSGDAVARYKVSDKGDLTSTIVTAPISGIYLHNSLNDPISTLGYIHVEPQSDIIYFWVIDNVSKPFNLDEYVEISSGSHSLVGRLAVKLGASPSAPSNYLVKIGIAITTPPEIMFLPSQILTLQRGHKGRS